MEINNTKILICEDDETIADLLAHQLNNSGYETEIGKNAKEIYFQINTSRFDLILLDLMLEDVRGEEILEYISNHDATVPVIVVSALANELNKVITINLGAVDYLEKPFSYLELEARIKRHLSNSKKQSGALVSNGADSVIRAKMDAADEEAELGESAVVDANGVIVDRDAWVVHIGGESIHLPKKEFELLDLLISNKGRVVTRERIIDIVWPEFYASTQTVNTHINRLRKKLDTLLGREVIRTIRGVGFLFIDSPKEQSS